MRIILHSFKNIKLLYIKISSIINYLDCYFDILYNITKADIKRQKPLEIQKNFRGFSRSVGFPAVLQEDGLDHPAGGVSPFGAGGQGEDGVLHARHDAGLDDGVGQAELNQLLNFLRLVDVQAVDHLPDTHLIGGEDVILVDAGGVGHVDRGVLLEELQAAVEG